VSPASSCPRCQTVVHYEPGERPVCPACGYPGADTRARPAADEPPAWRPAPTEPHRTHAPAEAWAEQETSGKAVAALVLGIVSYFFLGPLTAILAIILGVMARRDIEQSDGALRGRGMASWGLWLGVVNIILVVLALIVLFAVGFSVLEQGR